MLSGFELYFRWVPLRFTLDRASAPTFFNIAGDYIRRKTSTTVAGRDRTLPRNQARFQPLSLVWYSVITKIQTIGPVNRNTRLRSFKFMKNVTLGARGFFLLPFIPDKRPLEPV